MATLIASPSQVPDKSILDISGKQIYLGNGYSVGTSTQVVGTNIETPWLLLTNPANSGKSLFSYNRSHCIITTTSHIATFKYYSNPTVTAAGVSLIPTNNRINLNAPPSAMISSQGPTVTSNGTEILGTATVTGSGIPTIVTTLVIVDPGFTILVTVTSSASPNPVSYQTLWYEIPYV